MVHTCIYIYIYMCVCIYIYTYIQIFNIYIHIHMIYSIKHSHSCCDFFHELMCLIEVLYHYSLFSFPYARSLSNGKTAKVALQIWVKFPGTKPRRSVALGWWWWWRWWRWRWQLRRPWRWYQCIRIVTLYALYCYLWATTILTRSCAYNGSL